MPAPKVLPDEVLYVANIKGGDISVIDVAGRELVGSIPVGGELDDVKADPTGELFYLSRKDLKDLACVGRVDGEVRWTVPLAGKPHHITVSPDGRFVFVPIFDQSFLEVVDVEERRSVAKIPVGDGSHGTRLSHDGSLLYVGTCFSNVISVVDTSSFEVLRSIPFPEAVRPFDLTPDGRQMYVQLSLLHGFLVVDLASGEIVERVDLPELPPGSEPAVFDTLDHGLAITPDGTRVISAATTGDYVTSHRTSDMSLETVIQVGAEPAWVTIDAAGRHAFVPCRETDDISIIDLQGDVPEEVGRVSAGRYPGRMVHWTADGR